MGGVAARAVTAPPPRFLADAMLGRLARWLRTLGYDTAYDPAVHDPALVAWADRHARVLLTRDRRLVADLRPARSVLVRSDAPLVQLRETAEACGLGAPPGLFARCTVCNGVLRPATAAEAEALVPARVRERGGAVWRCGACGRAYWEGSHTGRMRRTLAAAFPEWDLGGGAA